MDPYGIWILIFRGITFNHLAVKGDKTQSQTWSMMKSSFVGPNFTELSHPPNHHISQLTYHQDAQGREPNRLTHEFGVPSVFCLLKCSIQGSYDGSTSSPVN